MPLPARGRAPTCLQAHAPPSLSGCRLLPLGVHLWYREPHQPVEHQRDAGAARRPHFHPAEGAAVRGGRDQHQRGVCTLPGGRPPSPSPGHWERGHRPILHTGPEVLDGVGGCGWLHYRLQGWRAWAYTGSELSRPRAPTCFPHAPTVCHAASWLRSIMRHGLQAHTQIAGYCAPWFPHAHAAGWLLTERCGVLCAPPSEDTAGLPSCPSSGQARTVPSTEGASLPALSEQAGSPGTWRLVL